MKVTFSDGSYPCPLLQEALDTVLMVFPELKIHVMGREYFVIGNRQAVSKYARAYFKALPVNDDYNVVVKRRYGKWDDTAIKSFLSAFKGCHNPKPVFHFWDGVN